MIKFSGATNRSIWLNGEKTNVSKTITFLVLRILVWQWLGKNFLTKYIPGQVRLHDRSVGWFDGRFAWIKVVCEQLGYGVPGPAQCEAIVPVDVIYGWLLWRGGPCILMLCPTLRRCSNRSVFLCWCCVLPPHIPPSNRAIYILQTPWTLPI
jgi:hypothetical protein